MASGPDSSASGGKEPDVIHLDLRTILPVGAFAAIILAIIFIELCGRDDVEPLATAPSPVDTATAGTPSVTDTPGPSPTEAAEATPTNDGNAQPGGGQRDVTRQQDLAAVSQALAQFRAENDSYPGTEGNIQTLCAFSEFDAGCALEEYLSPLPNDPLGDPGTNGYWYQSDGNTYTVWAQRESSQGEECENHPDHLSDFDSLFCVAGQ